LRTQTPSVSGYVANAIEELEKLGLTPELTAMCTIFGAEDIALIREAIKVVHESVFAHGALRVVTTVTIDERLDKEGRINQKIRSITSGSE
jgi:uncharacterized protein (TIGR00106 family)